MNQELKQKWIEALRSGNYKQGRSLLRTCDNRYCCLGVLCDIAGYTWKRELPDCGDYKACEPTGIDSCSTFLPTSLAVAINTDERMLLRTDIALFDRLLEEGKITQDTREWLRLCGYENIPLSMLNDQRVPFAEIATLIERGELMPRSKDSDN